jgi:hypothetical protein
MMHTCKTYTATIYCGLKEGYDGTTYALTFAEQLCWKFVNKIGLCVTVTPTKFYYKDGYEDGVIVGLINYPRFPVTEQVIYERAVELAEILKDELRQNRVSIVFPDKTIMLGDK